MLRNDHPIIELILKYRTVVKLISTYLEGLKPLIDKKRNAFTARLIRW